MNLEAFFNAAFVPLRNNKKEQTPISVAQGLPIAIVGKHGIFSLLVTNAIMQ